MISIEIGSLSGQFYAENEDANHWLCRIEGKPVVLTTQAFAQRLRHELEGYSYVRLFAEDNVLSIPEVEIQGATRWLAVFDVISAKVHRTNLFHEQIVAIIILCLCGDEIAEAAELYPVAEAAIKEWPTECRLIP